MFIRVYALLDNIELIEKLLIDLLFLSFDFDFILFSVKSNNTMQIQSTKYTK